MPCLFFSDIFEPENIIGGYVEHFAKFRKCVQRGKFFRRTVLRDHFGRDTYPPGDLRTRQAAVFDLFSESLFNNRLLHIFII